MKQRIRVTFGRGEAIKFISHLDLMRLWARALRRTGLPLTYSQGFHQHPRFSLASPLAVGVTSDGELMEFYLERRILPHMVEQRLRECLPPGVAVREVKEVGVDIPALPTQVRWAEYRVLVAAPPGAGELEAAVQSFLALKQLPWQHARDKEVRHYDLRGLVVDVHVLSHNNGEAALFMRLRNAEGASGRPEQVARALGLTPLALHRTQLILGPEKRKELKQRG